MSKALDIRMISPNFFYLKRSRSLSISMPRLYSMVHPSNVLPSNTLFFPVQPTWLLFERMEHMHIHGPVSDIPQHPVVIACPLVSTLNGQVVPVRPVHGIFKDGQRERVWDALHHDMTPTSLQIGISETRGRQACHRVQY